MFHECKLFDPHRVLEDGGIMSNTILVDVPTEVINGYLACINPLRLYVMDTHNMPNFMSISRNDYLTKDDKGSTLNFKDDHHDLFILGQTTNSYWFFWIDGIDHEEHCIGRITKNKISEDELVKLMLLDMASERKLFVELEVGDFNIV
jgi:hypothetical protein